MNHRPADPMLFGSRDLCGRMCVCIYGCVGGRGLCVGVGVNAREILYLYDCLLT